MANSLDLLQLVKFEDVDGKASGYDQALSRRYKDYSFEENISLGVILAFGSGVFIASAISVALSIVGSAAIGATYIFFKEKGRRKGVGRFLQDPEAKYLYRLEQAADAYNEDASIFNKRLLAVEAIGSEADLEKLKGFRDALDKERKDLQKRINLRSREALPAINMFKVWQAMRDLREAESQLALPAPASSERPIPPQLTESKEYQQALAELDAEFPLSE